MAAPTFDELYDIGKAEALARRPSVQFRPGDVSDMLLAGYVSVADRLIGYLAERIKATYLDGARGDDLTTLADDHWGIVREAATAATGTVTITRSGTPATILNIASGTTVATARDSQGNDIRFTTNSALSWGSGIGGAKDVNVTAVTQGVTGNVAAGAVNRVVTTLTESIAITNAMGFAGGAEEETDSALRERVRLYPSTIRRGTMGALEYGAKTVSGVAVAKAVESPTGLVTLYVTDASGGSTSPMVTSVAAEIENWRAAGAVVTVVGGALLAVDVQVTLTVRAGIDTSTLVTKVTDAVTARMDQLGVGETLYRSALTQVVRNIDPNNILEATVALRSGAGGYLQVDVAPLANQIIRLETITVA